jgi:hypothetical protein
MPLTRGSFAPSGDYPQVTLASADVVVWDLSLFRVGRCDALPRALFEWRICRLHRTVALTNPRARRMMKGCSWDEPRNA